MNRHEAAGERGVRLTLWPDKSVVDRMSLDGGWRGAAACHQKVETRLFFPPPGAEPPLEVKRLCFRCPVRKSCAALGRSQTEGWYGGEDMSAATRKRQREARAPEVAYTRAKRTAQQARAQDLRRRGLNNKEIAEIIGVHRETIGRWFRTAAQERP